MTDSPAQARNMPWILPGATLGVLGGGQLGRMFCVAARTMGYYTCVLDPDPASPAGRIADRHIQAAYDDPRALDDMAGQCDVITTEFENIPAQSLRHLARQTPVFPGADVLETAQDRQREKGFAAGAGLRPVPYHPVAAEADFADACAAVAFPAILKSARLGYDGKGQVMLASADDLAAAFDSLGRVACVLEQKIDLRCEISVIVARNRAGQSVCLPVSENRHVGGILHAGIVPARVDEALADQARGQALRLADALDYVGVLAVEFFIADDGQLYFNEMAPRPHNSGHYSKDACVTSQFEQQVRMICGLPPGDTRLLSPVVMINMLGELWPPDWPVILQQPNIKLHLYGKHEARPGRKMGHFNVLADDVETALSQAQAVFARLQGSD